MLLCDTHCDTLYSLSLGAKQTQVTIESLQAGDFTRVQAFALFTGVEGLRGRDEGALERMLSSFEALKAQGLHQITALSEAQKGAANALLTVEGGEVFHGGVETVEKMRELGVRIAAIVWNNDNLLAYPAKGGSREGLTAYGHEIVKKMIEQGIAVDVSHLNERGFEDIYDTGAPFLATHSCCRALRDHFRNLTDVQIKRLIERNGFIGVNFYVDFLTDQDTATLDTVVDHIDHICQLGGAKHVGFGSDFDGCDKLPKGLKNARELPNLLDALITRGFDAGTVEDIAGMNFARFMAQI